MASATSADVFALSTGSSVNGYYNGWYCKFTSGVASGESRLIVGYTGATKTVTLSSVLSATPGANDTCVLYHAGHGVKGIGSTADVANNASTVNFNSGSGVIGFGQDAGNGGHFIGGAVGGSVTTPGDPMGFGVVAESTKGGVYGKGGTAKNTPGGYFIGDPGLVAESIGNNMPLLVIPQSAANVNPAKGGIYFPNSGPDDGVLHFYNGTDWRGVLGPFKREKFMSPYEGASQVTNNSNVTALTNPEVRFDDTASNRVYYAQYTDDGTGTGHCEYVYSFRLAPGFDSWSANAVKVSIESSSATPTYAIYVYSNATGAIGYMTGPTAIGTANAEVQVALTAANMAAANANWAAGDKVTIRVALSAATAANATMRFEGCSFYYTERNTY